MIRRSTLLSILVLLWIGPNSASGGAPTFEDLVVDAAMDFQSLEGFSIIDAPIIGAFPFDRALRDNSETIEVRYAIRPIARMEIDYKDPHGSTPSPEHIFPQIFGALVGLFSDGGHSPSRRYPDNLAKSLFNANWASAATFNLDPAVSKKYSHGFLLALHKNRKADAYALFLYNDPKIAKTRIQRLQTRLIFYAAEETDASGDEALKN